MHWFDNGVLSRFRCFWRVASLLRACQARAEQRVAPIMHSLHDSFPRITPTAITWARLFIGAGALYYFFGRGLVVSACILYLFAALLDWIDGMLARETRQITRFGTIFDPLVDKIIILAFFFFATKNGYISGELFYAMATCEALSTYVYIRALRLQRPVSAPSWGKYKKWVQDVCALCIIVLPESVSLLSAFLIFNPLIVFAIALSGASIYTKYMQIRTQANEYATEA